MKLALLCLVALQAVSASPGRPNQVCHGVSSPVFDGWCNDNCNHVPSNCPASFCSCDEAGPTLTPTPEPTPTPTPVKLVCVGQGPFAAIPSIAVWCEATCNHVQNPHCPESHCLCVPEGSAMGPGMEPGPPTPENTPTATPEPTPTPTPPCGGCGGDAICLPESDYCYPDPEAISPSCGECAASTGALLSETSWEIKEEFFDMSDCDLDCASGASFMSLFSSCTSMVTQEILFSVPVASNMIFLDDCSTAFPLTVLRVFDTAGNEMMMFPNTPSTPGCTGGYMISDPTNPGAGMQGDYIIQSTPIVPQPVDLVLTIPICDFAGP